MSKNTSLLRVLLALSLLLAGLCMAHVAQAQGTFTKFKTFAGNINFTGTQVSLRSYPDGDYACYVSAPDTQRVARLSLPTLSKVVSAQLYWAGSGYTSDKVVRLNGTTIYAARSFTASVANGIPYFSNAADVTSIVRSKGSGDYTFSGLSVNSGSPHCERNAVLGGFALVVVYSNPAEPFRNMNIYEGLQPMYFLEVRFTMTNFRVPDNVTSSERGRFGHVIWEGDEALSANAEAVYFTSNGSTSVLTNGVYAPAGNQFNSKSSINASTRSVGIDVDTYDIGPFAPRQSSATATFRATEDMVLLNTVVLALPSAPLADLAMDLALNGELKENAPARYTLAIENKGPAPDDGPFTVRITLPTAQTYISAKGSGWSCSASGSLVTCSYRGTIEADERTPPLTLETMVTQAGEMTVTASVTGSMDPDTSNNTRSVTATTVVPQAAAYKFTSKQCAPGAAIGSTDCPLYTGTVTAGTAASIWITAVTDDKAQPLSTTRDGVAPLKFALGCVNPASSTVVPQYAVVGVSALTLDKCSSAAQAPAWKAADVPFPANTASVKSTFTYLDVGMLRLLLQDGQGGSDNADIVSVPDAIRMVVKRVVDGYANPGTTALDQDGFAMAGERFTIAVEALSTPGTTDTRTVLPSFGNEHNNLRPVFKPVVSAVGDPENLAVERLANALEGSFSTSGPFAGDEFTWSHIGAFAMTIGVDGYLGTTTNLSATQTIGRFYPAYLATIATGKFACVKRMTCPSSGVATVTTATYSAQPFEVRIGALDVNGKELEVGNVGLFDLDTYRAFVPALTLAPVAYPGAAATIPSGLTDAQQGQADATRPVSFSLGAQYDATVKQPADGWPAPKAIYLRATAPEKRGGKGAITLTSLRGKDADGIEQSVEGGVMVVAGRLEVANVFGSELLRTRVPMKTQFWTGKAWAPTATFNHATLLDAAQVRYTGCTKALLASGGGCVAIAAESQGALPLVEGKTVFVIAPIGANKAGSVLLHVDSKPWLPSTRGRVTFGQYQSPLIYVREVY